MKHIILTVVGIILAVGAVAGLLTFRQVNEERLTLSADLQYRTRLVADSLKEAVEPNYIKNSTSALRRLIDKFADREHFVGLAVYDGKGNAVATSTGFSQRLLQNTPIVGATLDSDKPSGVFTTIEDGNFYIFAEPLHEENRVVGAFIVIQDSGYIEESIREIWKDNLFRILIQLLVFIIALVAVGRWIVYKPLRRIVDSIKTARGGTARTKQPAPFNSGPSFFNPLAEEIGKMTKSLRQARLSASEEARMRLEKLDTPWTAERLKEFIKAYLKNRPIYLFYNREPYTHTKIKNEIHCFRLAAGGLTALEPLMEACGGMWFAHGSGNADKETSDENGKIAVPPDDPKYTLKRVWLTEKEVAGYYRGFSTEGLYPLCLTTYTRPIFRKEDWIMYRRVNSKYAEILLAEIKNVQRPIILVQDYHFSLLPDMIKKSRPDAQIGIFWHIPWPSAEQFSICPYRKEILQGMLGADVIGFNTQQFCNNFLNTVSKEIEALIDLEQFSVTRDNHTSYIRPFPISIAFCADEIKEETAPDTSVFKRLGITTEYVGLGVDRMDYAKGIPERFKGVEFFLDSHPEYRGKFTFLQIASPHRESVEKYREYKQTVIQEAARVNNKFKTSGWQPIVLETVQYSHEELIPLYRLANVCVITSLHDSMNLVAKEYIAARNDEAGALVLSQFAGASRDLKQALIVNPYSSEEIADAIYKGITMPQAEQRRRMKSMRDVVRNYNVYRWAAEFLKAVTELG